MAEVLNIPPDSSMFIDGYSGLTFQKVLQDPNFYLAKLQNYVKDGPLDILSVDLKTNGLCYPEVTVAKLLGCVTEFTQLLLHEGI